MYRAQIRSFLEQDHTANELSKATTAFELAGLSIQHVQVRADARYDDHSHDVDKWVLTMRGCGRMVCEGREFALTSGTVMFIPAGAIHRVLYQGDYEAIEVSRAENDGL